MEMHIGRIQPGKAFPCKVYNVIPMTDDFSKTEFGMQI